MRKTEIRRKYRLTRLGFHFLFIGTFAMLGGALRGFNLLLVLAGLIVGALIMQWRWSRRSVEAVSVQRRLPTEAFAGKPFRVRYRLRNHSRIVPIWMMRVEDRIDHLDKTNGNHGVCAVGVIPAKQVVMPYFNCAIARRGCYHFGPITLMTTFPFSLFSSRKFIESKEQLHVYPELLNLHNQWQRELIRRIGGVVTTASRSGPSEGDFFGLREWKSGDSRKWIHWRTTARLNQPAVRQFEQQRRFDTAILVDAFHDGTSDDHDVELSISLAATLLVKMIGMPSNRVVLAVAAQESIAMVGAGSSSAKKRILELLAEVHPSSTPSIPAAIAEISRVVSKAHDLIVLSPRSMDSAIASDPKLVAAIAPWWTRGAFRWIDVQQRDVHRWVADRKSIFD